VNIQPLTELLKEPVRKAQFL